MGHEDKGHFAAKHKNGQINEKISQRIQSAANDSCIECASAHRLGKSLNTSPGEIGVQIDLLEYQIIKCQLGLFGYTDGEKKIDPDIEISPALNKALDAASKDGRISCLACWSIAKNLKLKRLDISSACEKKSIRIRPCQLGAF